MKSNPINSIDNKYSKNTDLRLIELIETCTQFNKIPLSSLKSVQIQKNFYYLDFYFQENFIPKYII